MRHACANKGRAMRAAHGPQPVNPRLETIIALAAAFVVAGIAIAITVGAILVAGR